MKLPTPANDIQTRPDPKKAFKRVVARAEDLIHCARSINRHAPPRRSLGAAALDHSGDPLALGGLSSSSLSP